MDRSSSHRSLRADRLAASPYRRPPPSQLKKSSSTTFATVKNIFSYALSPLFRSTSNELTLPTTTSDLPVEVEQKSESGSEDNWNGSAPALMKGQDVFDLATAGGRDGNDFEERAAQWRAKGEVAGGRRDIARRSLEGLPPPPLSTQPKVSQLADGTSNAVASSSSSSQKRPLSPPTYATPIPSRSFLPPAATPAPPVATSASSVALTAFLDAKKGQQLTPEDFIVIDTLTNNMKAEAGESPNRQDAKYGGWSAGMSPRPTKSLPSSAFNVTPARSTTSTPFGTPASTFSLGTGTPISGSPNPHTYRQRYLGPGMSPRRMLNNQRSTPNLKPLFHFSAPSDESAIKKRRVEGDETMDVDNSSPSKSHSLASFTSSSNNSLIDSPSRAEKSRSRVPDAGPRPHPLSQSTTASSPETSRKDPVTVGKRRAADIMLALLEEQMVPETPSKDGSASASSEQTHFEIINPYHKASIPSPQSSASQSSAPSTPATRRTFESPRKPVLRSALKDTPKRGAAARLEASKSERKLTTVEKLTGVKPWDPPTASPQRHVRIETPTQDKDRMEVDADIEVAQETSRSSPVPPSKSVSTEPTKTTFPEPEPFKPFPVPTFESPARPITPFQTKSSIQETFDSPTQESALASAQSQKPAPKFQLLPSVAPSRPEEDEQTSFQPSTAKTSSFNATHIYFTAKDQALKVVKEALPFYTFTLPAVSASEGDETRKAKDAALKVPIKTFTFSLPTTPNPTFVNGGPTAAAPASEWTCDTCMLKNPSTATEQCYVCESPKPGQKVAAPAPPAPIVSAPAPPAIAPTPFQWPGKTTASNASAGEWTCGTCMLKNPASATEKCTICETPK